MLDVITDFWKPVKKANPETKPDLDRLNTGSSVTFGVVPQALLSERKLKATAINTYQFGDERMTSFILAQDREDSVAMIVASADGEQYLALSRRIPFAERMKLFDPSEVEAVMDKPENASLSCRDVEGTWKNWLVSQYKKEISGVKGSFTKGDYRGTSLPTNAISQPFDYLLFTSDNNEYAVEVEKYADGRLEFYATIYRRVTDIVEVEHPQPFLTTESVRPSGPSLEIVKNEMPPKPALPLEAETKPLEIFDKPVAAKPVELPELKIPEPKATEPLFIPAAPSVAVEPPKPVNPIPATIEEKPTMQFANAGYTNGASNKETENKPYAQPYKQEVKAVNNTATVENDAIECDLRVANKIIDEAIRNEMRLSDVVRRVIALPVANPESVHIPIMLTDSDFSLLAIRYSIAPSDREAIKRRIIEELNDFSGGKKQ